MKLKYDNGNFEITNANGATIELASHEFWELCRQGERMDVLYEIEEYIDGLDEVGDVNAKLMDELVDAVIRKRAGYESGDDIYDVIQNFIKRGKI